MILYGFLTYEQSLSNNLVAAAFGYTLKYIHLALSKTFIVAFPPDFLCQCLYICIYLQAAKDSLPQLWLDVKTALMYYMNGLYKHCWLYILQQIACSTVFQKLQHIVIGIVNTKYQHLSLALCYYQLL